MLVKLIGFWIDGIVLKMLNWYSVKVAQQADYSATEKPEDQSRPMLLSHALYAKWRRVP